MGVPSLFRWFEKKFPGVVRKANIKHDTCDNLYIDANSIVHNVCHPSHRPPPSTEEQMLVEIEAYLTHVIKTANPTKLIFIAIDGVAPQAKISQQRQRRFRAAKEATEVKFKKERFIKEAREQRIYRYDRLAGADDWDSNAITPGTPFMAKLDKHMHSWLLRKFKTDPFFQPLTVIFSGSAVPGEGEHKAMDFIRRQRCQPGYQPLKHAFYGPDADLILLALATHEPSFRILREDPREKHDIRCIICQMYGHAYKVCPAIPENWTQPSIADNEEFTPPLLIFFDVWLLRIGLENYLKLPHFLEVKDEKKDSSNPSQPIKLYDHERSIDDFILLVALMGNDFIPALPLPKWEIHEGAINKVVDAWRKSTISQKGYIVKNGNINPDRLENLFRILSGDEDFPPEPADEAARYPSLAPKKDSATPGIRDASILSTSVRDPNSILWARHRPTEDRSRYREDENLDLPEGFPALAPTSKAKSGSPGPAGLFEEYVPAQDVGTDVYEFFPTKMTYYERKLGAVVARAPDTINNMVKSYVEGLQWVMQYYCQGCPDWKWYYPYHYAPWPSDCVDLSRFRAKFKTSGPLPPFSQLMSVFPPASAEHIPKPYRYLMLDATSVLKEYYPTDFATDRNGKVQEWKSVVLLSHIDPKRLQATLEPIWNDRTLWTPEERMRNRFDVARVYVCDHERTKKLFQKLHSVTNDPRQRGQELVLSYSDPGFLAGKVSKDPKLAEAEIHNRDFDLQVNEQSLPSIRTISACYAVPKQITPHSYKLLPNQPEMHFNYKLIARLKRDTTRLSHHPWPDGVNVGRDARQVAEEIASGIKPQFVDWQATGITNDDMCASEQAFEPLPYGFDEFLLPLFPPENEALTSLASLTLDEEEEEGPELVVDQGAPSSHAAWNVFNRSTTIPDKRTREKGPSQPALTASGYTRIVPQVKDEEMEDDTDSDEDEYAKAKRKKEHARKFRKQKPAQQKQPSVKREYSDDEGWL